MVAIPNTIPAGAYALVLLGDLLVFLLIGLAFRLLRPRRVAATLWVGPVVHLYTLAAVFVALYEALRAPSILALLPAFGSFLLAALLGTGLGLAVGRKIPVQRNTDGKAVYTGGPLLVGLTVFLLLPLALEQAIVLFGSLDRVESLLNALKGAPPFNYILLGLGFLFVLGTFLSLAWRGDVWRRRDAPDATAR